MVDGITFNRIGTNYNEQSIKSLDVHIYPMVIWYKPTKSKTILRPKMLVQKHTIRVIHITLYYSHTNPNYLKEKKTAILKLNDLFDYQSLLLIHDYML